jgi:hypothetical protein
LFLSAVPFVALGADPKVITVPDPDTVSPGFLGFAVMFLLAVATLLLIRSMVGHLRKVRYLPEPPDETSAPGERVGSVPDARKVPDAGPGAPER